MRDKLGSPGAGQPRRRGIRWLAGTTDHACPVCGFVHSLPAMSASPAELRAFRARLGRTLRLPPGEMLTQQHAAKLLGVERQSIVRYEAGSHLIPERVSDRMRKCLRYLANDPDRLRRALGVSAEETPRPSAVQRKPAPFRNF